MEIGAGFGRAIAISVREGAIGRIADQDILESNDGKVIPTPWCGRFWNYNERSGMQVPLDGEVAWLLPDGAKPYWRGNLTEIIYEFAR